MPASTAECTSEFIQIIRDRAVFKPFLRPLVAGCVLIAGMRIGLAQLPPAATGDNQFGYYQLPTPDLQSIQRRLEQQDEELRELRSRLGALQNDVRSLPPVSPNAQATPAFLPTAASSDPVVFELKDRLSALEKKVDANDATAPAAPKGYEVGSDLKMSVSWKNG